MPHEEGVPGLFVSTLSSVATDPLGVRAEGQGAWGKGPRGWGEGAGPGVGRTTGPRQTSGAWPMGLSGRRGAPSS